MKSKPKAVMNWSGGKDSALALHKILEQKEFDVKYLLTSVNKHWQRVSMHGVRRELLKKQSEAIGIELIEIFLPESPSMEIYETEMNKTLGLLQDKGVSHSIFGDIFLQDLREYREKQLNKQHLQAVFPLWQIPTENLIEEFIELGFRAVTVCVDAEKLDRSFCGRLIDQKFVAELPTGIDVCGENGEFHSFVFNAPFFRQPIEIEIGEIVFRDSKSKENVDWSNRFYFCDLLPKIF
jgi:uncharacterized protein (TIGR00290 family)